MGFHFWYHRRSKEALDLEIKKQQAELFTGHSLQMVARSADWIAEFARGIRTRQTSYFYKHVVEQWRRDARDEDPYVHNGAFIAAGLGNGKLDFIIDSPNVVFKQRRLHQWSNGVGLETVAHPSAVL